ncbi:GNAT family N-acetyltransferase [Streptosporangium roseum]|uniref:GNAT family N-acetyltransferase n=1 Tax=Streptosporangium roseum TaxID=2001 RepID=UPI000692166F|nr:GNAT family N-acetyltransferase [Streptosporangium roseum]
MEIPLFEDRRWSTCPHPVPEDDESDHEAWMKKGGYGHAAHFFVHDDSPVQLTVWGDGLHGGQLSGRAPAGHMGTGVGRALMDDALPHLGPRAVLWVLEGNERARRFYEEAGWSADDVTRDAPMGGELTHQLRYARTAAR